MLIMVKKKTKKFEKQ